MLVAAVRLLANATVEIGLLGGDTRPFDAFLDTIDHQALAEGKPPRA